MDFDLSVHAILNKMPRIRLSNSATDEPLKAYFKFELDGIDKQSFLNKYEIKSINLNGKPIMNNEITYDDDNGFRFYSSNFEDFNDINLILQAKDTNKVFEKNLKAKIMKVF